MAIKKGDSIKVEYTGTFNDGSVFDTSEHDGHHHPIEFKAGEGMVIKGFDEAVIGMNVGEEKTIKVSVENAYGDVNPELVRELPRDKLPPEAKEGMLLGMQTPNGQTIPVTIKEVNEKTAKIDFNHPLAGKELNFKIRIASIN